MILSPIEASIKRKIEAVGTPLKDWNINIYRGVLTGLNEAFIISTEKRDKILANCADEDERRRTEELIRPILRGRDIKKYRYDWAGLWIIATFPSKHYAIEQYPSVKKHLLSFATSYLLDNHNDEILNHHLEEFCYKKLSQSGEFVIINGAPVLDKNGNKERSRKKTSNKWFEVQDSISYWDDFYKQKIVWGNLNLSAAYSLAPEGMFLNAPSNMIVPASRSLLCVLNSKLADYYIRSLGVTRNGGYFEYKPMFIEQLPVPTNIDDEPLNKEDITSNDIDVLVYQLYGLTEEEINHIEHSSIDS